MNVLPGNQKKDVIVVVAEHRRGELSDMTLEMLACGREVADNSQAELQCIILADGVEPFRALPLAADKVLLVQDKLLSEFSSEAYVKVLAHLLRDISPRLVILGNTSSGTDLCGPLSFVLKAMVVGNAISVSCEGGRFLVVSKVYGGKILARCEIATPVGIVLLSPGVYPKEKGMRQQLPSVDIVGAPLALEPLRVRFKKFIEPEAADVDISKVPILVAVGRGIQSKDNIALAENLARVLGGAVCATRPVVDQAWLPRSRQVGRSGMTVKPRLYLALGISGAPEHVEGMKDAELIIAINLDESAPIFDVAHYGSTSDVLDIVPALTRKIKEKRGG